MTYHNLTNDTMTSLQHCTMTECDNLVQSCTHSETLCNDVFFEWNQCIFSINTTECNQCAYSFEVATYNDLRTDFCQPCFDQCANYTHAREDSTIFDHYYKCYMGCGNMTYNDIGRNTTTPTIKENDDCVAEACLDYQIACSTS